MVGDRVILAVKYTPAEGSGSVRRQVGGFLRYVQYRDKHADQQPLPGAEKEVKGLLKYVAFRDRTSEPGRLFDSQGPAGNQERRAFADHVSESLASTRPQLTRAADGKTGDRRRAVYRFVLSPERADGLDLRELTKAAMERLEREAGPGARLRWLAAEHRNTAHPHVHIALAGMREVEPGRYRSLLVTRARLANMKEALGEEITRQREERMSTAERSRTAATQSAERSLESPAPTSTKSRDVPPQPQPKRSTKARPTRPNNRRPEPPKPHHSLWASARLRKLAGRYRRQLEREAEEERYRGRER